MEMFHIIRNCKAIMIVFGVLTAMAYSAQQPLFTETFSAAALRADFKTVTGAGGWNCWPGLAMKTGTSLVRGQVVGRSGIKGRPGVTFLCKQIKKNAPTKT